MIWLFRLALDWAATAAVSRASRLALLRSRFSVAIRADTLLPAPARPV